MAIFLTSERVVNKDCHNGGERQEVRQQRALTCDPTRYGRHRHRQCQNWQKSARLARFPAPRLAQTGPFPSPATHHSCWRQSNPVRLIIQHFGQRSF